MSTNRPPNDDTNPEDELLADLACIQAQRQQQAQDALARRLRAMPHLVRLLGLDGLRAELVHGDDTQGVTVPIETTNPKKEPDFLIEDFGREIYLLRAMSDAGRTWAAGHLSDLPRFAGGRVVDQRYIAFVRRTLPAAGFVAVETAYCREDRRMVRKLSMMSLLDGDVWGVATLYDDDTVTLEGEEDALEDFRVIGAPGPDGQARPRDGAPYFDALKKMFERMTYALAFEPHEEQEARRKVKAIRDGEARKKRERRERAD
jgi:hypothetical protein